MEKDNFFVSSCFKQDRVFSLFTQSSFRFVVLSCDGESDQTNLIVQRIHKRDEQCKIILIVNQPNAKLKNTLQLGANDYIKRTDLNELSLRLWLLKRQITPINSNQIFNHKDFFFHENLSLLQYKNKAIRLSKTERLIIDALFRNGVTVETEYLVDQIWGYYLINGRKRLKDHIVLLIVTYRLSIDTFPFSLNQKERISMK